jgi:hypothetical protein
MIAISSGATLTGGRVRAKWRPMFASPAARYLPEPPASGIPPTSEPWIMSARQRLNELAGLAPGWDGAIARAVGSTQISSALGFLASELVAHLDTKPDVVPTYDGGLLIEWHTEKVDLIIELGPDGASFYACDNEANSEVEAALGDHVEAVTSAFVKLGLGR